MQRVAEFAQYAALINLGHDGAPAAVTPNQVAHIAALDEAGKVVEVEEERIRLDDSGIYLAVARLTTARHLYGRCPCPLSRTGCCSLALRGLDCCSLAHEYRIQERRGGSSGSRSSVRVE